MFCVETCDLDEVVGELLNVLVIEFEQVVSLVKGNALFLQNPTSLSLTAAAHVILRMLEAGGTCRREEEGADARGERVRGRIRSSRVGGDLVDEKAAGIADAGTLIYWRACNRSIVRSTHISDLNLRGVVSHKGGRFYFNRQHVSLTGRDGSAGTSIAELDGRVQILIAIQLVVSVLGSLKVHLLLGLSHGWRVDRLVVNLPDRLVELDGVEVRQLPVLSKQLGRVLLNVIRQLLVYDARVCNLLRNLQDLPDRTELLLGQPHGGRVDCLVVLRPRDRRMLKSLLVEKFLASCLLLLCFKILALLHRNSQTGILLLKQSRPNRRRFDITWLQVKGLERLLQHFFAHGFLLVLLLHLLDNMIAAARKL
mmetsp:Transcript_2912/g.6956  ORF Transcript_2912/g.6956 Transcript_2912/m.6956 type:complete len:367 (+) Transcript_2912:420-1520(+)